jgi:hypothetical protein
MKNRQEEHLSAPGNIPDDFGDQLARLHPGIVMLVLNDLLQAWFPPGAPTRALDQTEISAAQAFAARFGCVFHYSRLGGDCEQGEGRFHKA